MAKPIRVKIDTVALHKGINVQLSFLIQKRAQALAKRLNGTLKQKQDYPDYGFAVDKPKGTKPPTAAVFTRSNHAKYSNAKHNHMIRMLSTMGESE